MRMSQEEFDEMKVKNPHLKISESSAFSEVDWHAIRQTESCAKVTRKHLGKIKKSKSRKAQNKPYVSPHAKRLAYFAMNPERIKKNQEHYEQVRFFDDMERHHPEIYEMLAAIPNGGIRDDKTASNMRAEGQKKGYPDITLDVARGIYSSLKIEMKSELGRTNIDQSSYHDKLRRYGSCVVVCFGYEAARRAVLEYWSLEADKIMLSEVYKGPYKDAL